MVPIWIYLVVAGIVISAYMAIRTGRKEREDEQEMIEREGEVYMKRLEQEKEEKKPDEQSVGV